MTSTIISIVSTELQNSRDGLLAEVLILKIKCYREEIHLLNHLTQPLSYRLSFVIGQRGLISIHILWKPAALVYLAAWQGNVPCYKEQCVSRLQKELSSRFVTKILEYRLSLEGDPVTLKKSLHAFSKTQVNPGPGGHQRLHTYWDSRSTGNVSFLKPASQLPCGGLG